MTNSRKYSEIRHMFKSLAVLSRNMSASVHTKSVHKSPEDIENELEMAKKKVVIGGMYSHYKNPEHLVKVIALGTQEATDKLCVIYRETANGNLIFVRDLDVWLENPIKDTPRFKLVKKQS